MVCVVWAVSTSSNLRPSIFVKAPHNHHYPPANSYLRHSISVKVWPLRRFVFPKSQSHPSSFAPTQLSEWHPVTAVYCSWVYVCGRGGKLRRSNRPSFAAQSPSRFHPRPISLSQWQSHAIALPQFSFTTNAACCKTTDM